MNLRKQLHVLCWALLPMVALAQSTDKAPRGKAIVQVFTNFHSGFGQTNDQRGFELDRSYLGYQYQLAEGLSAKAVIDIGQSKNVDDYHRIAYIKNAQITWNKKGWTLNGGLISTTQFNMQEKFWGYRYIMKCFQDEYKFGSSADLGASVAYKFNSLIAADFIVTNGEGYKKIQVKDGLQYGLGLTLNPLKGLQLRFYGGVNEATTKTAKDTWNYAAFIGYKINRFSIGAEFNYLQHYKGIGNDDLSGFSIFGSANINKNIDVFARYDNMCSRAHRHLDLEEHVAIAGAQFRLGKYIKLAPNLRITNPKLAGKKNEYSAFVNCYFGL